MGDVRMYARKVRSFQDAIAKLPTSKAFSLDRPEEAGEFDLVVIGSDEVWNLRHPWFARQPAFFGQGLLAGRVVSYAASFGNYSCWEGIESPWADLLRTFDALSVRDENSWWMLKNSLGIEAPTVLDPCLQWPVPAQPYSGAKYALVYGHRFSDSFALSVRKWAKKRGLPLLSLGYRNDWADRQWLTAGPHEFARALSGAEAVATNFFHGSVFALSNHKPFACEASDYRSIKLHGLMELIGDKFRLVDDGDAGSRLDKQIDRQVHRKIEGLREASDRYLDQALEVSCRIAG